MQYDIEWDPKMWRSCFWCGEGSLKYVDILQWQPVNGGLAADLVDLFSPSAAIAALPMLGPS